VSETLSDADFQWVCRLVRERAAIVLDGGKTYLVETRLAPVAQREGFATIHDLVAALRAAPFRDLHRKVVEALTTNETSFFRDPPTFDALRAKLLPELIRARSADRRLDIWCAASSTGQEPYSIALLLREHFPELAGWVVSFVASDLNLDVLARAREGVYSQIEVNRGLPAPLLAKYFEKRGASWQIRDDVRRMIQFTHVNLAEAWPPLPPADLVFLRNVLIYFDLPTRRQVFQRLRSVLRADGHLVLGGTETTINVDDSWERRVVDRVPFYRLRR
jgi:chemotaxis protein methyltransferase CheR